MFKQKQSKNAKVDTLIGPKTRINGDVEFTGGLHLDGYINGNVKGDSGAGTFLSVSQHGSIEGEPSIAIEDDGQTTHHREINAVSDEGGQQLFEAGNSLPRLGRRLHANAS